LFDCMIFIFGRVQKYFVLVLLNLNMFHVFFYSFIFFLSACYIFYECMHNTVATRLHFSNVYLIFCNAFITACILVSRSTVSR